MDPLVNALKNSADKVVERESINAWDWLHAKRYCERYLQLKLYRFDNTTVDDARAFTTAIVVTYSRPFSGNRGRDGKKDPIDQRYLISLDPEALAVH